MVVITGDLFDGMIDGLPGFAEPLKRLSARKGVYFVSGNHEVYAGLHREQGFAIYTSSGVGTWGPPMRTGTSPEIVVFTLRAAS